MYYFIRNSSIDKGEGAIANEVSEIIHTVGLLQKELLLQDKDSRKLTRIQLETFIPML
jgi:hypothetical protein